MSELEIAAAALTLASVALTVVEDVWCWPVGVASVILSGCFFWEARYYAQVGLHVVFLAVQFYGWYEWLHGGAGGGEREVRRAGAGPVLVLALLGVAASPVLGAALAAWTTAEAPYLDAVITVFSLIAQWLLARKFLETWLFWVGVDILAVALFVWGGHHAMAALYAILLAMAVTGYRQWMVNLREPKLA